MSWYELLLFVHIAMAVIWVGGGLTLQLFGIRMSLAGDPARTAAFGHDVEWIGTRVFVPASLLAFLTGVLLVVDSDLFRFRDDWIVIGLLLYATTFFAGFLFFGPESGRLGKLVDAGSPEAGARMARLILLTRLDLVLLFFLVFVMTVKPEIDDQALLEGLVGAAIACVLVYWRYRVAVAPPLASEPPPPPAAGDEI
jgi:uncharacterized membrane protein